MMFYTVFNRRLWMFWTDFGSALNKPIYNIIRILPFVGEPEQGRTGHCCTHMGQMKRPIVRRACESEWVRRPTANSCTIFSQWKNLYKQIICPPFYKLFIIIFDICFCHASFVRCTRYFLLSPASSLPLRARVILVSLHVILPYWMVILFTRVLLFLLTLVCLSDCPPMPRREFFRCQS